MANDDKEHLVQAAKYWREGHALEAGRLIFESLPPDVRPKWAAGILRLVLRRSNILPPDVRPKWPARMLKSILGRSERTSLFEEVLHTSDHPVLWVNGHRVFSKVRASTLRFDNLRSRRGLTSQQELVSSSLALAELVAKVIYNATDPPDEFDEDSGWWIAECLRYFVDWWKDEEFAKAAWSALCFEDA